MKYLGDLFPTARFYIAGIACVVLFVLSFLLPVLEIVADLLFGIFILLLIADYFVLFFRCPPPQVRRLIPERISNGFDTVVNLIVKNVATFFIKIKIIDELPLQFQERNFELERSLQPGAEELIKYRLHPVERGEYYFGNIIAFVSSKIGLFMRRFTIDTENTISVYPAFQNLRTHQLMAQALQNTYSGSKQIRKIGQSMEFEQIKDYVTGDDIRTINWKATARRGNLMVNNYTEEKSQQIIAVIDKGRVMKMPFKNLSLLDYAINSTLALANLSLLKQDKFGVITFSNKPGTFVLPDRRPSQRENIIQTLYKESTDFKESDFESLYLRIRSKIKQRSLVILFTNFESLSSMERQLPYLRSISRYHFLLVVFFENSELSMVANATVDNMEDIYVKTIAEKFVSEKTAIVKELQKHGIAALLTQPEQLTVHLLNKYLELKAKQVI